MASEPTSPHVEEGQGAPPLQGIPTWAAVAILGSLPVLVVVSMGSIWEVWPKDLFARQVVAALLAGPLIFGYVASYGSLCTMRRGPPGAAGWALGAYVGLPLALTIGSAVLDLARPGQGWSSLAFGGIALIGTVPFAITSLPLLWPDRLPRVWSFSLAVVVLLIQAPGAVIGLASGGWAYHGATGVLFASSGFLAVTGGLVAILVVHGLTHSRHPPAGGAPAHEGRAEAAQRRRWVGRLGLLLLGAGAAWLVVGVMGVGYLKLGVAPEPREMVVFTAGYLLGLGLLALALGALTRRAPNPGARTGAPP